MAMTTKRPIRQWVVDHDSPYIARTPEEAHAYFKRRRAEANAACARTRHTSPLP